ncbi:VENN motif pre-toxin domain-containing protein [Klebsiella aerogenes]|nr:VENN motif pre-toxin domain-containing protein [Klebsiella aerogenes]QXC68422.1 VENN motif pre-toxin domain-containing protein [Klebsiella aerogenes]
MTGLSRDAAYANQTLSPIFDKEKEQNRLATAQKIGEIGRQVSDVLVTQGKLNAQAAQSDPAARAKLVAGGYASPSEEQISAQVSRTATADYDTGGKYQKVAQAVTAAMQGLAGGNLAQAASGAVSPYVAEIIHSQTTDSATGKVNVEANAMAHAVWGAIAAASGNNSALAGAAGAVSGELLGRWIAAEYYPGVKTEELSDEQKSTISALSTLAAGLMGGLSGGSSADAVAGAQAGKNAVENNALSPIDFGKGMADMGLSQQSLGVHMLQNGATPEELTAALIKNSQGQIPDGQNAAKGLMIAWAEFFGVPVSALAADGEMTPQRAAEILASGVPTSEAKLVQYVAAKAFLVVAKNTSYPSGISFKIDQLEHMGSVVKYNQQKGITGGHNADAFYSTVSEKNVKIVGETQSSVKGITEVQYKIPAYDRAGNITGYKDKIFTKTIYDPKIFTDQKMLELGQQAASSGYKAAIASGQREYTATAGGIKFQVYLDKKTGMVENFHPVTK